MPVALGYLLFAGPLGSIFSFGTLVAASQAALAIGVSVAGNLLLRPKAPDVPKPEDGKYNLRQNVPSPCAVLGRTKKGSDYLSLEMHEGVAYHVMAAANHRIHGFVAHWLHDEQVTLSPDVIGGRLGRVVSPGHFEQKVWIETRRGLNAETAYSDMIAAFPGIWTADHRGDGVATVMMGCDSVSAEDYQRIYPNQMPVHTSVVEGALLFDPREPSHDADDPATWSFSTNLALMRLWHLTHPSGGKLRLADMHLPDWIEAANVADETVVNRDGNPEPRYHGGFWYRYENNPVDVGRVLDQAADMVIYETSGGKIGVHAGRMVEPDVRLTENDILSLRFDTNRRRNGTVLAVRGRYTDPAKGYNTVDAAIRGNPYLPDSDERTRTVENQAVQSHNHMQRLQELAKIRANAPRVSVVCDYEPGRPVPYRRFVRVHVPPKLDEAIIEITGRPKLSLRNLTCSFEGIVVPASLYDAIVEGDPPADIDTVAPGTIPVPQDFDVAIVADEVALGQFAAYGLATWALQNAALNVEFEWQKASGGPVQSARLLSMQTEAQTGYLIDGETYRFRARNWSGGVPGEWTDYVTRTVTINATAPVALASVSAVSGVHLGNAPFQIVSANDANLFGIEVFRTVDGGTFDAETDMVDTIPAPRGSTFTWVDGDGSRQTVVVDGDMSNAAAWPVLHSQYSVSGGKMTKVSGTASSPQCALQPYALSPGKTYRGAVTVDSVSGSGNLYVTLRDSAGSSTGAVNSANVGAAAGTYPVLLVETTGHTHLGLAGSLTRGAVIDNLILFEATAACVAQGKWQYRFRPINQSRVPGPISGPVAITVY